MKLDNQICLGFAAGTLATLGLLLARWLCSTWKSWRVNRDGLATPARVIEVKHEFTEV